MSTDYVYELLPLNTSDEDPRWATYLDIFSQGFLNSRRSPEAVAIYQQHRRADSARLGMVTTEGPGLEGRQPVAAFASIGTTINCGAGLVDALLINTIVVRASHRRRGLLTLMMREQLDAARAAGRALAVLTASEATIYGRFGFGVCDRHFEIAVDTRRFALRDDAEVAPGVVEFVHPEFLKDHQERIARAHQERYRGAVALNHVHWLIDTAQWDPAEGAPSKALRALVHFDSSGTPDGYAVFTHQDDSSPATTHVRRMVSPDPAIDRALWQTLASTDLVERLTYDLSPLGDPLALSLVDPWAVSTVSGPGSVWLRILDLPSATAQRRFDGEGSIVARISDEMGYLDGTWRITAADEVGTATRVDEEPEVGLAADTLARLWHGDRRATELSRAGLIRGERKAIRRFSELMWTAEPPVNVSTF